MIEPTIEMLNAYEVAAARALDRPTQGSIAALAAVLAIVERDYELSPRVTTPCRNSRWGGQCQLEQGHPGNHRRTDWAEWS